jgi:hypothetical protein
MTMLLPHFDYNEFYQKEAADNFQFYQLWYAYDLGTAAWWLCVLLTVVPWIIFWLTRDRQKTLPGLLIGSWVCLFSIILDRIGLDLDFWHYNIHVLPVRHGIFPWDAALLPTTILIALRYSSSRSMVRSGILYSLAVSFVGQPLFDEVLHFVHHEHWRYGYSLPFMFFMYAGSHYLYYQNPFKIEQDNKEPSPPS